MILPFKLQLQVTTLKQQKAPPEKIQALIRDHENSVLTVCKEIALVVLKGFREAQLPAEAWSRTVEGYADALSLLLNHVDFITVRERKDRVTEILRKGAKRASIHGSRAGFAPPALELVITSSYCLAYPGGVDLCRLLTPAPGWFAPQDWGGDPDNLVRICGAMDRWWSDTSEGVRRMSKKAELENKDKRSPLEDIVLAELQKTPDYYLTSGYRLWESWAREGPEGEHRFRVFASWISEGRAKVQLPEERRRSKEG